MATAAHARLVAHGAIEIFSLDIQAMLELVSRRMDLDRRVALVALIAVRRFMALLALGAGETGLVTMAAPFEPLVVVRHGLYRLQIRMAGCASPLRLSIIVARHADFHCREILCTRFRCRFQSLMTRRTGLGSIHVL